MSGSTSHTSAGGSATGDGKAGDYAVTEDFERFSQVNDVFSRSFWDRAVRDERTERFYATYRRPLEQWRKANGFTQRDYAVRNAAWHVADVFAEMYEDTGRRDGFLSDLSMLRDPASDKADVGPPEQAAADVKAIARTFGADLVGVAAADKRWHYTERFSVAVGGGVANVDLDGLDSVVVVGQAMDRDLIRTAPSALSGAATGLGYSQDALVLLATAQYIRNLGYRAVPSMNDTALAIPYALAAGLGEYGRHGMLIAPELGPRLRLGKIFTDMPLATDRARPFGVTDFCRQCDRCVTACPSNAIPDGQPTAVVLNQSNIKGVRKWSVDGEACFSYWSKINSDCAICVRVCPFNRDFTTRRNRYWLKLATGRGRRLALWLHDRWESGHRLKPNMWWDRGGSHGGSG